MITEAAPSNLPNLRGYWLWFARIIWILIALVSISLFLIGTVEHDNLLRAPCNRALALVQPNCLPTENALKQLGLTWDDLANFYMPIATVVALPWILLGCLVFWRKSGNIVALLFSLVLVLAGSTANPHLPGALLASAYDLSNLLIIAVSFIHFLGFTAPAIIFCLFPDGRFVPRWSRWLFMLWIGLNLYDLYDFASGLSGYLPSLGDSLWSQFLVRPLNILLIIVGIYSLIFRYRHDAGSLQRQQIKWVMVAVVVEAIFQIGFNILGQFWQAGFFELFISMIYEPLYYLSVLFGAVCFGISISRYRLWDIDILSNRTLVYGLLTAIIVGIYVIVVGILGTVIQERSRGLISGSEISYNRIAAEAWARRINVLISALATGLVAILFQPLRNRLQRGINRLMYGERDNPYAVLSRLGQRLEAAYAPESVLATIVETVAQTLKLPYVAISLNQEGKFKIEAEFGSSKIEPIDIPLIYQGEPVGELILSPRAPGDYFTPAERQLLSDLARQAGSAAHAVRLTIDLQRSRERLVAAREEERRRLRRDLHDGLGPNLASQGLKLAAVKQLLKNDSATIELLLDQVMAQNRATVEEVRRLVYGLRPPALDELGLVAAIRDHVTGMDKSATVQIEIAEPARGLPPLSAAVEVATYWIVLEALTNVIRHAQAKHCAIRFSLSHNGPNSNLQIEVIDDGIGLPRTPRAGVGTRSMRERAEEVGGSCVMESGIGSGTRVCVKMPLIFI